MKHGQVNKIDKRNEKKHKKMMVTSFQEIMTSFTFFQFTANLEQSGSRIPDPYSIKLMFSSTVTFYLTKNENRTKKPPTQLSHYCFE